MSHHVSWHLIMLVIGILTHLASTKKMAQFYGYQTKILEGWTKEEIRMFEALFKGVSTRFELRTIETSVEHPDFFFCSSFQNLRLGSIELWTYRFYAPGALTCGSGGRLLCTTREHTRVCTGTARGRGLRQETKILERRKIVMPFVRTFHTPKFSIWAKKW